MGRTNGNSDSELKRKLEGTIRFDSSLFFPSIFLCCARLFSYLFIQIFLNQNPLRFPWNYFFLVSVGNTPALHTRYFCVLPSIP
ncbi:hypothetical protein BT96DRAFT_339919 [Gymnopus androsaceus JB14]|uniref:Uncharacterized protein n=1 Tax=Gymnopus androsaceus JB14 TaxID=1447944 RepID=A0A6A4I9H1_9AGAR|nr:hypothetical protein BT96DRAFT_339919 [Gymnopus androsaceus JB14]